jgi:hypothetical protein
MLHDIPISRHGARAGYSEYPHALAAYPERLRRSYSPGYSEYSHGVSRAWTRVGGTRDGSVSGSPSVLACLKPSTPGVLGVLTRGPWRTRMGARRMLTGNTLSLPHALCEYLTMGTASSHRRCCA